MVNAVDLAKRALVKLLKEMAAIYTLTLSVARDSPDPAVRTAYRKVSVKAHPDRGGDADHQRQLNAAYSAWEAAAKAKQAHGGKGRKGKAAKEKGGNGGCADASPGLLHLCSGRGELGFRFQSAAVLLTYQKFETTDAWGHFVSFVKGSLAQWSVKFWGATMETNFDGTFHFHLMLQFKSAKDRAASTFAFEGKRPNAQPNDLLGEGWCGRAWQESVNRAFFYVFADKEGTVRDEAGEPCWAGNYEPAWLKSKYTYPVSGRWLDKLHRAYKLSLDNYESYVFLSCDGVVFRKRNIDAIRAHRDDLARKAEIAERAKRLRANPDIWQPFQDVPEAQEWLNTFKQDAIRYPLLVVFAPSLSGKTEWAKSLFVRPYKVEVGPLISETASPLWASPLWARWPT